MASLEHHGTLADAICEGALYAASMQLGENAQV
jgi:hypothetical protein